MDDDGELHQYIWIRILRNLFQHQRFLSEARDGEPEVIWIGDSLIQNLFNSRIWDQSFCLMHSVNFGISGDRTENVLWRLENGELEEVAPKVKLKTDNNCKKTFINILDHCVVCWARKLWRQCGEHITGNTKYLLVHSKQATPGFSCITGKNWNISICWYQSSLTDTSSSRRPRVSTEREKQSCQQFAGWLCEGEQQSSVGQHWHWIWTGQENSQSQA